MMCLFCDTAREDRKYHDKIATENARLQDALRKTRKDDLEVMNRYADQRDRYKALAERRGEALEEAQGKVEAALKWIGGCSCKHCPEIRRILRGSKEGE